MKPALFVSAVALLVAASVAEAKPKPKAKSCRQVATLPSGWVRVAVASLTGFPEGITRTANNRLRLGGDWTARRSSQIEYELLPAEDRYAGQMMTQCGCDALGTCAAGENNDHVLTCTSQSCENCKQYLMGAKTELQYHGFEGPELDHGGGGIDED